jgi:glycosyltransferase involved in cell wall biosynthesis
VYRSIDLLVVPSLWEEPLATTVLEAYMHGIPVIVSRRGGLPEMVDEGRTGFVYEPLEAGGLRQAVDMVLRNPLIVQDMRPLVLEKARDFALENMKTKYLHVLTESKQAPTVEQQQQQLRRRSL